MYVFYMNISGFRVFISASNALKAVGYSGYDIVPGHSTSIGFDITEHNRLSEPYSECRHVESLKLEGDVPYSYVECRNMCVHKIVNETCGCWSTRYVTRRGNSDTNCGQYRFFNETQTKQMMACQKEAIFFVENHVDFGVECNCFWPCHDTTYHVTISQSAWPDPSTLDSFTMRLIENHPRKNGLKAFEYYQNLKENNATNEEIYSWVNSHFARLNVFAQSNIVVVKQQVPMYSKTDLLSQIGGCLGLWLGMSVITVVELFDLGLKIFIDIFSHFFYPSQVKTVKGSM